MDVVVVDTSHGHSAGVIRAVKRIKSGWPNLQVIAGNVVTEEGTLMLIEAGADYFITTFPRVAYDHTQLKRFAAEVMPQFS